MRLPSRLDKPWYLRRPWQLARRFRLPRSGIADVQTPWGAVLRVRINDNIGQSIAYLGVFDLVVTETLSRLVDPGDIAIDVGANIGYTASLLSKRAGKRGEVMAFEPNPRALELLSINADRITGRAGWAPIRVYPFGLSSRAEELNLVVPKDPAHLGSATFDARHTHEEGETRRVPVASLDDVISSDRRVGLMKIDVEGFEFNVLRGAQVLLEERVRDIVFEETANPPTPVIRLLETAGFAVRALGRSVLGLRVGGPGETIPSSGFDAPSYLATRDLERAIRRLSRKGWSALSSRHRPS
jgi:FkbM family methyltransferase